MKNLNKMMMVTSDEKVAELIEKISSFTNKFNNDVPSDLLVTSIATGSKEYIEWVKNQTE